MVYLALAFGSNSEENYPVKGKACLDAENSYILFPGNDFVMGMPQEVVHPNAATTPSTSTGCARGIRSCGGYAFAGRDGNGRSGSQP